jgi:hypothetical protein
MSYIGSTPTTQSFIAGTDSFNGTGSATNFTLSRFVNSTNDIQVVVNNVVQYPPNYSVSGNTLTISPAPSAGTNNVYVRYLSTTNQSIAPSQGTIGKAQLDIANFNGTGGVSIPVGTTLQRPSAPVIGMQRFNTTLNAMEYWDGSLWSQQFIATYSVEYLVVAGGGAGGNYGGGGGAGGYLSGSATLSVGTPYPITVGAGGAGATVVPLYGGNGVNSSLSTIAVAIGGGGGGGNDPATADAQSGRSGGSGGGASTQNAVGTFGAGTTGQGNRGGSSTGSGNTTRGGGGGGAGAVGVDGSSTGNGGAGTQWLNGTTYAGGGGGGGSALTNSVGGTGGGGAFNTPGTANTGGGGGSNNSGSATNRNGGSGIVIVRYSGVQRGSGGTVTSSGGYTYHTFNSSGTYTA